MADKVTNYQCPACTGPLHFDSATGKLVCDYCGSAYEVADIEAQYAAKQKKADTAAEADQKKAARRKAAAPVWDEMEAASLTSYTCTTCGAELVCDATTAATNCPYCGNPTVLGGQLSGKLKPEYIIPFKMDRKTAIENLKNYRSLTDSAVEVNLKYIIHLVGDMHCPAHIKYTTHNMKYDVLFEDKYHKPHKFPIHSVWDNEIITTTRIWSVSEWADELDRLPKAERQAVAAGTPRDWLHDNAVVCEAQFEWAKPGQRLGQDFLNEALPLIERQIRNAGYRLARVLNELFG